MTVRCGACDVDIAESGDPETGAKWKAHTKTKEHQRWVPRSRKEILAEADELLKALEAIREELDL